MAKFLLLLTSYVIATGIGILVMIFGWGVEPVSWGWILGGTFIASFVGALVQLVEE